MKLKTIKISYLFFALLSVSILSCTDLEEQVVDEKLGSESPSPENAIAAAYGQLGDGTFVDHGNVFGLQEYSTDEAILPTRGSDWGDGGKWRALSEFTWDASNPQIKSAWDNLNFGITKSLTAIQAIEKSSVANKQLFLAEAKGLLAFYTYHTLDLYGQAPYRDPMDVNAEIIVRKADVAIDELITEVEGIIPNLANIGEQSTHMGRFTKQAAYALLADMYMNRAVLKNRYSNTFDFNESAVSGGGSDMDKVIEYSSNIINSGRFKLESNFFHNFDISNDDGTELIFAVVQKATANSLRNSSNNFAYMPVERAQKPSPDNRGTNATGTTPEFYHSWDGNHEDPRFHRHYQYEDGTWFMNDGTDVSVPATSLVEGTGKPWFHFNRGIQAGVQYGPTILANGSFEMVNGRIKVNQLKMEKNTNLLVNFTPEYNFDNPLQAVLSQNQINRGARVFKYEFDPSFGNNGNGSVNISLFRLGGIYTLRAEAYFRKGNTSAALADINMLRTSRTREALFGNAPGVAITTLDEATLVKEIAFETYWELVRRKQLIRFGKFEEARTAKSVTAPTRRIYPIPQATIDASNVFTQNKGY